jgi:hypothetical protein
MVVSAVHQEAEMGLAGDGSHTFFVEGIRKLVASWTKCIEKEGNYVEK